MTGEQARFARLMDLFNDALELSEVEREAFLNERCNGDTALQAEVKALLAQATTTALPPPRPAWEEVLQSMNAPAAPDLTGTSLGHYEIRARLGAGGMGEVWRAWDHKLQRDVALKILPPEFAADPERIARFQQEAYTASALNHPNIITIYEFGSVTKPDGEFAFIVTEFIAGQTLRESLAQPERVRNWRAAVRIATQIASALSAAHTADLIHRDIKPENIMVTANGQVKVLDFGIAKLSRGLKDEGGRMQAAAGNDSQFHPSSCRPHPSLTAPGARLGTIRYMSPEQARCEDLDGRTDIFSLGVVLYELLTG